MGYISSSNMEYPLSHFCIYFLSIPRKKWKVGHSLVNHKSLHTSQVAHQARTYPGFLSMKRLRVFLLPPGWDVGPSQGYPQH